MKTLRFENTVLGKNGIGKVQHAPVPSSISEGAETGSIDHFVSPEMELPAVVARCAVPHLLPGESPISWLPTRSSFAGPAERRGGGR